MFRQYIPKKHKRSVIKIYKLCEALGYTYDISIYIGKQRLLAKQEMPATHGTVLELVRRLEGLGHNYKWIVISNRLLCSMICSGGK